VAAQVSRIVSCRSVRKHFHQLKQDRIVNIEDERDRRPPEERKSHQSVQREDCARGSLQKWSKRLAWACAIERPDRKWLIWIAVLDAGRGNRRQMTHLSQRAGQTEDANGRATDPRSDHVERDEDNSPSCARHSLTKASTRGR
jgi:hypothetical protein